MDLDELLRQIEIGENQDFEFKSAGLGLLQLRYPELSHPQQAYKTVSA